MGFRVLANLASIQGGRTHGECLDPTRHSQSRESRAANCAIVRTMKRAGRIVVWILAVIIVGGIAIALRGRAPSSWLGAALNAVRSAGNAAGTLGLEVNSSAARTDFEKVDART